MEWHLWAQLWSSALRDMGDCPLLVQITVSSLHIGLIHRDMFTGLALFSFSYPHRLPPLPSSPSFNPNAGGPKVGVPAEEFGSWKNSGRRRIWKSGRGNSLPAERQSWVHDCGSEDAERYLSRQHTGWLCLAHLWEVALRWQRLRSLQGCSFFFFFNIFD